LQSPVHLLSTYLEDTSIEIVVSGDVRQELAKQANLWVAEFPAAITVCDPTGIILEMNAKAVEDHRDDGGKKLIGSNLFDCHPEPARTKLKRLMERPQVNVYTTERAGVRRLICQTPWYRAGKYRGFVQLSLVIPGEIPHLIRAPD
jgi:transcriptional regulator with PAS, ATPase and Fis domain